MPKVGWYSQKHWTLIYPSVELLRCLIFFIHTSWFYLPITEFLVYFIDLNSFILPLSKEAFHFTFVSKPSLCYLFSSILLLFHTFTALCPISESVPPSTHSKAGFLHLTYPSPPAVVCSNFISSKGNSLKS